MNVAEEAITTTTFKMRYGHYEFLLMPFVLTNALPAFMAVMNKGFLGYEKNFTVFLHDILVNSKNEDKNKSI